MTPFRQLAIFALIPLLFLAACIPQSLNPLTPPGKEIADPAILGTWSWQEKDETIYLHMGIDKKNGGFKAVLVDHQVDGKIEISEFSGHTSRLGNNTYLNLKWLKPEDNLRDYLILKYVVTGNRFSFDMMDNDVIKNAIAERKLKGSIHESKWLTTVRLTDTSDQLADFVIKNDKLLFKDMKSLKKLTP